MTWKSVLSPDGTLSGLSLGMHVSEVRDRLSPIESLQRQFDPDSTEFNSLTFRRIGLEVLFDGQWNVIRISCFPASSLSLLDGTSIFALGGSKLEKALASMGFTMLPRDEGFFATSPEIFGGRFLKGELIVFTISVVNLKQIVLDALSRSRS